MVYHLDADFLVYAIGRRGPERDRLWELAEGSAALQISAVAWYEYCRGPRPTGLLAVARSFFPPEGVVPFSEEVATRAAELFRALGSPRTRAADIAIGATALSRGAVLLTRNARDFEGIPDLVLETVA